ncbi:hypothetical protein, partial [Chromobacterium amazonense]|uniref:hypothetical protein n=1 Tax=Chromobacterium amazonense TaxID=1382803 RepID=UPI0031F6D5E7
VFTRRFQVAESLGDRLHYVGHPVAGHLAIAMGLIDNWATIFADPATLTGPPTDDDWNGTRHVAQLAFNHVAKVEAACNAAADIRQAQRQLGHASVVMTESYTRKRKGEKVSPTK